MTNRLKPIIAQKQREVSTLQQLVRDDPNQVMAQVVRGHLKRTSPKSFKQVLSDPGLSVIAEIKRRSPSKGALAPIAMPLNLAKSYVLGGAKAISVVTDEVFFGGSITDLQAIALGLQEVPTPILRKDFIIDALQIAQAVASGADAILAIVALLGQQTKNILDTAKAMGIEVLVEVHDRAELDIALHAGAEIIGVNNRDLMTFQIDTERALKLVEHIPTSHIRVAESGIVTPELAKAYHRAGFDAVLIGEALVLSASPDTFIRACCHE